MTFEEEAAFVANHPGIPDGERLWIIKYLRNLHYRQDLIKFSYDMTGKPSELLVTNLLSPCAIVLEKKAHYDKVARKFMDTLAAYGMHPWDILITFMDRTGEVDDTRYIQTANEILAAKCRIVLVVGIDDDREREGLLASIMTSNPGIMVETCGLDKFLTHDFNKFKQIKEEEDGSGANTTGSGTGSGGFGG